MNLSCFFFFFNDTATTEIYPLFLHLSLFFFNDTAPTEISTLSLHDALPISHRREPARQHAARVHADTPVLRADLRPDRAVPAGSDLIQRVLYERAVDRCAAAVAEVNADRKSTRLNSSHLVISYAVFCLKKKK